MTRDTETHTERNEQKLGEKTGWKMVSETESKRGSQAVKEGERVKEEREREKEKERVKRNREIKNGERGTSWRANLYRNE